jgi:hypothetical protein
LTGLPTTWVNWNRIQLPPTNQVMLILDGVLEADWGKGARTGIDAASYFCNGWEPPTPAGALSRRSFLAVRLAQNITADDPSDLSRWLYAFGRVPKALKETLAGRSQEGLIRSVDRLKLNQHYASSVGSEWEYWERSTNKAPMVSVPRHKLYISPGNRSLDDVVHLTSEWLCEAPAIAFKITRTRAAATRPDKFIVYFHSLDKLEEWAANLSRLVDDFKSHGVPFTLQMNSEGLLSRALDPKPADKLAKAESWRSWCTDRLGWSLSVARYSSSEAPKIPHWHFALFRIGLDGVDVSHWKLFGEDFEMEVEA